MLVGFEGIDGSGKTSLCDWIGEHVRLPDGRRPLVVHWNSFIGYEAELPKLAFGIPRVEKDERKLGPLAFSLWHCADFAYRWEGIVRPALVAGNLVLMDRFIYTALVRDVTRGVPEEYVRSIYAFAPAPDLLLYLDCTPELALQRKTKLGYYESGEDLLSRPGEARRRADYFVEFQRMCRERYLVALPQSTFVIESDRSIDQVRAIAVDALRRVDPQLECG
jgi:dTMP kinase